jgi:hypothetical protein
VSGKLRGAGDVCLLSELTGAGLAFPDEFLNAAGIDDDEIKLLSFCDRMWISLTQQRQAWV